MLLEFLQTTAVNVASKRGGVACRDFAEKTFAAERTRKSEINRGLLGTHVSFLAQDRIVERR